MIYKILCIISFRCQASAAKWLTIFIIIHQEICPNIQGDIFNPSHQYINMRNFTERDDVIKWKHFRSQRPVTRSFDVFFYLRLSQRLSKHRDAGDLRHHRAYHDVTVMSYEFIIGWFMPHMAGKMINWFVPCLGLNTWYAFRTLSHIAPNVFLICLCYLEGGGGCEKIMLLYCKLGNDLNYFCSVENVSLIIQTGLKSR